MKKQTIRIFSILCALAVLNTFLPAAYSEEGAETARNMPVLTEATPSGETTGEEPAPGQELPASATAEEEAEEEETSSAEAEEGQPAPAAAEEEQPDEAAEEEEAPASAEGEETPAEGEQPAEAEELGEEQPAEVQEEMTEETEAETEEEAEETETAAEEEAGTDETGAEAEGEAEEAGAGAETETETEEAETETEETETEETVVEETETAETETEETEAEETGETETASEETETTTEEEAEAEGTKAEETAVEETAVEESETEETGTEEEPEPEEGEEPEADADRIMLDMGYVQVMVIRRNGTNLYGEKSPEAEAVGSLEHGDVAWIRAAGDIWGELYREAESEPLYLNLNNVVLLQGEVEYSIPIRKVRLVSTLDGLAEVGEGTEITITAEFSGFAEDEITDITWLYRPEDDSDGSFLEIEGAHDFVYTYTVTPENIHNEWRVVLTLQS